jgi:membrane peptidoglycan carboxypeptidase
VVSWNELWESSQPARQISSSWLYETRHRRAQDIRLRTRIEQDAFAQMTPYWRRLGFPFERLVPSYATAIGNSSDRPAALADLMGIILNDGQCRPTIQLEELRFAQSTPYHTVMRPSPHPASQVLPLPVARALKNVLAGVVKQGTARRLAEAFKSPDGTSVIAGGKTGSGDNRFKSFSRGGSILSSRAVNRTAVFAFYIGDRYFGVISASVLGKQAESYKFTSALPVTVLKLLAPALNERFARQSHLPV